MSEYHEPHTELSEDARNFHRALTSLKEEVEAVDWYHQRAETCTDPALRAVLEHNRDEEIEHACMTIEWLRRRMPAWDEQLRAHLYHDGSIVGREHDVTTGATSSGASPGGHGLGLGSLRESPREEERR